VREHFVTESILRPDGRRFLIVHESLSREQASLLGQHTVDAEAEPHSALYAHLVGRGFVENRRKILYEIPADPRATGLEAAAMPDGFSTVPGQGLARGLLAEVVNGLARRGVTTVVAEVDENNDASNAGCDRARDEHPGEVGDKRPPDIIATSVR
jgi:ribosomal protein S18 acetylase RimI-like enzyme